MQNYKSATNANARAKVEQTIREEIMQGNYVTTKIKPTVISALGAIPKPNSTEVRLIPNCSRPHGQAVNDYITTRSFKFQSLDDAIKLLKPNCYMAKIDLKHAYRSVPIHPANYQATGCKWRFTGDDFDTFFYDTRLPFGAKSSPEIFHRLTQAVGRMMAKLTFLGVQLDSVSCTMTLPAKKLAEFQTLVRSFLNKRRASKNQLQRLAGKLNWACRVIYGRRTFLRRVLDTMNSMSASAKHKLSASFYRDLSWWVNFLTVFNGTRLFLQRLPMVDVMTDACSIAAGGYFGATGFILTLRWTCQHGNTCTSITRKRWLSFWLLSAGLPCGPITA